MQTRYWPDAHGLRIVIGHDWLSLCMNATVTAFEVHKLLPHGALEVIYPKPEEGFIRHNSFFLKCIHTVALGKIHGITEAQWDCVI